MGVPAVHTAPHFPAFFPMPLDSPSPSSDTAFLQFLCSCYLHCSPPFISVPFIARATNTYSFVGSLALLICYFFFFSSIFSFTSHLRLHLRLDKPRKFWFFFQVLSFPHSPSLQQFQLKLPFLEHETLYFQWAFMSTWYHSSNTSQPLWELSGMHLISCWIFPMSYQMVTQSSLEDI